MTPDLAQFRRDAVRKKTDDNRLLHNIWLLGKLGNYNKGAIEMITNS